MSDIIPPLLNAPPDGSVPKPPIETREQVLPFSELSWINFERLILRIVRNDEEIIDCSPYGIPGEAQHGIDILAIPQNQEKVRVCYQCKKVKEFGPSNIIDAIDKFLDGKWADQTQEFVLCVAISLQSTQQKDTLEHQRKRLLGNGIKLSIWDGSNAGALCERLKNMPDLVDDFFGRIWVERFNGREAATSLGERLDRCELDSLKNRLLKLYTVLFAQHDPGLHITSKRNPDYQERYVPADISEQTKSTAAFSDPAKTESPPLSVDDGIKRGVHSTNSYLSTGRVQTYETRKPVLEWLCDHQDCLVLGEPGYGKSALLRYLTLSMLQPEVIKPDILDSSYYSRLPVWISFARLSSTIDKQSDTSVEDFYKSWLHQRSFGDVFPLFVRAARSGQVLLLLDGLDEALIERSSREALERVITFMSSCNARIICTSRPRGYKSLRIPGSWATATLTPLSNDKIELLATRWFTFLESGGEKGSQDNSYISAQAHDRAKAFLNVANSNPKTLELARNPLLCQALIELFRVNHRLPEARVTVYKQILDLLLSQHPDARAHVSGTSQPVDQLDLNTKDLNEILIRLAKALQFNDSGTPLDRSRCEEICSDFLEDDTFGLGMPQAQAKRPAREVIKQLLVHYGVLVEPAPGELGFLHLSIQEYFAAEYIARLSPEEQLEWMSDIWLNLSWREILISWFGILGGSDDKVFFDTALQRLTELGKAGEWQRMQSLELRTEIVTTDLDLSVIEADRIIEKAAHEVEVSVFPEFRTALARSITLGALGSPVRDECQSVIRRWMPGRSASKRTCLLEAFKNWEPSDILWSTLLRALHDEDARCRRAASETFAVLFSDSEEALSTLKHLAITHIQPEVRAAALHGLGSQPKWADTAVDVARANIGSANADLLLIASRVRIQQGLHDETDLDRVWCLWATDAVDFWFRHELVDLLCAGWPQHPGLHKEFTRQLENKSDTADIDMPLEYLMRCYPGNDKVAEIIAKLFEKFGKHLSLDQSQIWIHMHAGFQENKIVSQALRKALNKYREEYKAIFWHPHTTPAFTVLGDNEARDDLLISYETAGLHERYWIASALFTAWADDEVVKRHLGEWANGKIDIATPLTSWGVNLVPDIEQRHKWLLRLAHESASTRNIDAITALLKEFPDNDTRQLAESFLEHDKLWYYDRVNLQGLFANKFPDAPKSLEILECSLTELDGPNPGSFAGSFQHNSNAASRLLTAAVTVPVDVRMTVATVLRERVPEYSTVVAMTPDILTEENSSVRTSCLMAMARAARGYPEVAEELADTLVSELKATGLVMDIRRRSALAGLLELKYYKRAISTIAKEKSLKWNHYLVGWPDGDPISIGAIVEHWNELQPLLLEYSLETELPVSEIVYAGYDVLLEQTSSGQKALDKYLQGQSGGWTNSAYFDAFARRFPKSASLRSRLLALIGTWQSQRVACAAARLLARNFSPSPDIWIDLSTRLGTPEQAIRHMVTGELGYLVLGWPEGVMASWVGSISSNQLAKFSPRDKLLIATTMNDVTAAEEAVAEMLSEPIEPWKYNAEDTYALQIWAESSISEPSIARWIESGTPSLSATAISLIEKSNINMMTYSDSLLDRFNIQCNLSEETPLDGLDAAKGKHIAWVNSVYSALKPILLSPK